jgi:hypothetical protein
MMPRLGNIEDYRPLHPRLTASVLLLATIIGAPAPGGQPVADDEVPVDEAPVKNALPGLVSPLSRIQLSRLLSRKVEDLDRACRLSDEQKKKLHLAGQGDIEHLLDRIEELRNRSQAAHFAAPPDDLVRENANLKQLINIGPFENDSLFAKVQRRILPAEQLAGFEAVREVQRLGGRVRKRARGQELEVHLANSKIDDDGCARIKALTDLVVLDLSRTEVTDAGLVHLSGFSKLETLDLSKTRLTDSGMPRLKHLTSLKDLNLSRTQVTSSGIPQLKDLKNMQQLTLSHMQLTDAGLAHLKGLAELRRLDLGGTPVSDAGLIHLRGLASLRYVLLSGTKVTDAGIAELKRALSRSTVRK